MDIWEHEEAVTELGIDVPAWIDQTITGSDVAAIVQGGCESGAYMPAVTYHQARDTMERHSEDIFAHIESHDADLVENVARESCRSWDNLAVGFVACAVELWADQAYDEIVEKLDELEEEEDGDDEAE